LVWRCGSWIFGRLLLRFIILWRADDVGSIYCVVELNFFVVVVVVFFFFSW
jgi:hypothetical protein